MDPDDLEQLIDRELRQLPMPRAPETLLPRVLAAADHLRGPWYRRPWLTWPVGWQVASTTALLGFVVALALVIPALQRAFAGPLPSLPVLVPAGVSAVLRRAREAAALMNVVSQVLLEPVAVYVFALAVSLSVACGALWSALNRAALGSLGGSR
jgi:hypothetical protein